MFFEEAVLRNRIVLPKGAPNFYDFRAEYCHATWVGPERTNIDPVKEMISDLKYLDAGVITLADIAAKRNKDWESQVKQRVRERTKMRDLGLAQEDKDASTVNERRKTDGKMPIPGGNAIYMPASQIPALEFETEEEETEGEGM
jgi:capsid protein